ncbi:TetR/AcrR family transcriptional regulator [Ferrimicrobium sp.]|uniref:TetR/AcrR family transcriptional regulator n=1 Tax=Ferrimicrobium sp. TaxID=2926050 RepID=UPI002625F868|nr:TetR/AcrR family transcriptional regulator [Ferrimicrobium sp.]
MGNVQETWRERREQILRAAMDVLVNDGASSLTIRSVAKAAGVDPALIYHYFSSKADLLQEVTYIPLEVEAELADPSRDLMWKLSIFDRPSAALWITALMICMVDARERGAEQFGHLLDLLLPNGDRAKRTMVVGLLFERHLLHSAACEDAALRRYTDLVEAV